MRYGQKYKKKYDNIMFELKLKNVSNQIIWETIGVSKNTFYTWLNKYKSFRDLYNKALNAKTDAKKALIKKATGFKEKIEKITHTGKIVEYEEYYPPDTQAIRYLLRNISDFDKELEHKIKIENDKAEIDKINKVIENYQDEVIDIIKDFYETKIKNNR